MNSLLNKMKLSVGAVIFMAVSFSVVGVSSLSNITMANADNTIASGRLVTIHDDGSEQTILTQALNIGDALAQAGVMIDDNDVVEPALDKELVANSYLVNIYRARPVTIVDDNIRLKIMTAYQTPKQIAEVAGVTLFPEDEVSLSLPESLVDGTGIEMVVKRAIPINLTLYGKAMISRTQAKNINDFLLEKNLTLGGDDRISVDINASVVKDMSIRIWREGRQTIEVDENIDFEVETIEDADLPAGRREIRTAGVLGKKTVIYEVLIQDDQEISRTEIASIVTVQPSKQIEVLGVRGQHSSPDENETIAWSFLIEQGFSRVQTAGIMGNLMQEHRFNTTDTAGGLGIVQWVGGRRDKLIAMYPDSYTNIYSQLNYLMHELNGSYAYVRDAIKASSSLTESVQIFQNQFERCGICRESNRISYAQTILGSH